MAKRAAASAGERLSPHCLETEQAVLGAILLDVSCYVSIRRDLPALAFYDLRHRRIYEEIAAMKAGGHDVDVVSLVARLRFKGILDECGGVSYISELPDKVGMTAILDTHVDVLVDRMTRRQLMSWMAASMDKLHTSDLSEIIDDAQRTIAKCMEQSTGTKPTYVRDIVLNVIDDVESEMKRPTPTIGVETGFEELDTITGGMQKEELIILAARPSVGKTSLAMNIAEHAALKAGSEVGIISIEMSSKSLTRRLLSSMSGVDLRQLNGDGDRAERIALLTKSAGRLLGAKIRIDDGNPTANQIVSKAKLMHAEQPLDLLIVDYLQLIRGDGRAEKRYIEIGETTKRLKQLAKQLHIPIMVLSQLSRASEKGVPTLADLSESSAIEQDADTVMLLYPEPGKQSDILVLHVAKQRNGPVSKIKLVFHPQWTKFVTPPKIEDTDIPKPYKE